VIVARALVGLAAGFLLSSSAVFVASGWQAGVGCLACAAVGAALGFDLDRVTRKSRWQENDSHRAAQALRDAANRPPVSAVSVAVHSSCATGWVGNWFDDYVRVHGADTGFHNERLGA
jgi:hypothetical protein